ncbi:MAG: hypothetical protein CM1200mP18_18670 [Gammaproteobacteria bacterium]|nr:MAG: hypothetical protein CM1200mP18_18670 [Gammaproteobacteria bacterium]
MQLAEELLVVDGHGPAFPFGWRQPATIFWERRGACRFRMCLVVGWRRVDDYFSISESSIEKSGTPRIAGSERKVIQFKLGMGHLRRIFSKLAQS